MSTITRSVFMPVIAVSALCVFIAFLVVVELSRIARGKNGIESPLED